MPNQISNWSITNVEKICREYIKVGFQQQDLKKKKTNIQALKFSLPTEPSQLFVVQ